MTLIHRFCLLLLVTLVPTATSASASAYVDQKYPLGVTEAKAGNWRQAVAIWKDCLTKGSPNTADKVKLYFSLAKASVKLGNRDKAIELAERALKYAPNSTRIASFLASLRKSAPAGGFAKQFDGACESLASAIENERLANGSGASLFEEAAAVFRQGIKLNHKPAFCHYGLATCLLETGGDRAEAKRHLEQAKAADPSLPGALYRLGEMTLDDGDAIAAVPLLERAAAHSDSGPEVSAALVRAYAAAGQESNPTRIVDLVTKVASANSDLALGLGDSFRSADLRKKIDDVIQRARTAEQQASSSSSSNYSSSSSSTSSTTSDSSDDSSPPQQSNAQNEPEKTDVEKNVDTYNENRYRDYLQHLNRLAQGKPSTWSGAIPKKPEKKK